MAACKVWYDRAACAQGTIIDGGRMTLALYRKHSDARRGVPVSGQMMPYHWDKLPNRLGVDWIAYSQMLSEFARELANIINRFTTNIDRLEAWSTVVTSLTDTEQMEANLEFIDSLATVTLATPYVIRSRFIFAAAHLCHQANRIKQGAAWQDDLVLDEEIYMSAAEMAGNGWRKFKRLKLDLENINKERFKAATGNFRHVYNHRFSPQFVIGVSHIVKRVIDSKTNAVTYEFGEIGPLDLSKLVPLLKHERDCRYRAFKAFHALVDEHCSYAASA